jgi:hypothetical protein
MRYPAVSARTASTDALQHLTLALASVGAFLVAARDRTPKSAIKVRGGRARARSAVRDERGRFLTVR